MKLIRTKATSRSLLLPDRFMSRNHPHPRLRGRQPKNLRFSENPKPSKRLRLSTNLSPLGRGAHPPLYPTLCPNSSVLRFQKFQRPSRLQLSNSACSLREKDTIRPR